MKRNCDPSYLIALYMVLFIVAAHLMLGYVFPVIAVIVIILQFITVYMMNKRWLLISWVLMVFGSYATIDIITYNPDGISAAFYSYMLSIMLAQLYSILLCVACVFSKHRAYKSTIISNERRVEKIKGTLSVYSLYALPVAVCIVLKSMYNSINNVNDMGDAYFRSGLITLLVLFGLHAANYMYTVSLIRAIEKSDKKEGTGNEVLKESSNGESVGQGDKGRADNRA